MNTVILAIIEIIAMLATAVFLYIGIKSSIDSIKINPNDGEQAKQRADDLYKRSFALIAVGIISYIAVRFTQNCTPMLTQGADMLTVVLQSLWEGIRNIGFLILIPLVVKKTGVGSRNRG